MILKWIYKIMHLLHASNVVKRGTVIFTHIRTMLLKGKVNMCASIAIVHLFLYIYMALKAPAEVVFFRDLSVSLVFVFWFVSTN